MYANALYTSRTLRIFFGTYVHKGNKYMSLHKCNYLRIEIKLLWDVHLSEFIANTFKISFQN